MKDNQQFGEHPFLDFLRMMAGAFTGPSNTVAPTIGDKVRALHSVPYLTDMETGKQLFTDGDMNEHLAAYLTNTEAIVAEVLKDGYEFSCGHCDTKHKHDCIIFYPQLNKRYYASSQHFEPIEQ